MTVTRIPLGLLCTATGVLGLAIALSADGPRAAAVETPVKGKTSETPDDPRVPLVVAKDRAGLMHDIYSATLDMLHHRYFRREGAVLPARGMEDVFAEMDRKSKIKTRWIAVNTPAMSLNHEPDSAFEKKAAAEIAAGKSEYEGVEKGYYFRATAIPLGAGCVGCHTKFAATPDKTPRFAGLVIAIPVKDE